MKFILNLSGFLNLKGLISNTIKEFFTSSQMCQFMDNENPLAELEHKRRLSATGPGGLTRERAGFEVRDVQPSHYGRICPIQTPEGPNIGLVNHLASFAKVNPYGFIETPYFKVEKNKVTSEICYLNAFEEEKHNIAHGGIDIDDNGRIVDSKVEARIKGKAGLIEKDKIVVWNENIKNPKYVRYGWADNPDDLNLYNVEGLPASPFRTDRNNE